MTTKTQTAREKYRHPKWCRLAFVAGDPLAYCWGWANHIDRDDEIPCGGCEYNEKENPDG